EDHRTKNSEHRSNTFFDCSQIEPGRRNLEHRPTVRVFSLTRLQTAPGDLNSESRRHHDDQIEICSGVIANSPSSLLLSSASSRSPINAGPSHFGGTTGP